MTEGTCLWALFEGGSEPCGIIHHGRVVYRSLQQTFMVKYHSFRGFHVALVKALLDGGVEELDLIMPRSSCRASVEDIANAPIHVVRREPQHFLDSEHWTKIEGYQTPHYTKAKKRLDIDFRQTEGARRG